MGSSELLENWAVRNGNGVKSHGEDGTEGLGNGRVTLMVNGGNEDDLEGVGNGGLELMVNGGKENVNLGDKILEDLDTYWEDINDHLIVSRMVSDSVIKGMVSAVEQEAAERLLAKEKELAKLKELLQFHDAVLGKNGSLGSPMSKNDVESLNFRNYSSLSNVLKELDKMGGSLDGLRNSAKEQFKKLKESVNEVNGSNSISNTSSHAEKVLEGSLRGKESAIWVQMDRALNELKTTADFIFCQINDVLQLSRTSLGQLQEEHLIEVEIEAMVMCSAIRSMQEDFECKLWSQYAHLCGDRLEKLNNISGLRKDLDVVLKSLSSSETSHTTSHGSSEHVACSKAVWNGNETTEDSKTDIPEHFDAATLKHMSREEIVNYFNNAMTKMKRHHESIVQKKTDDYFALRAEFLTLRGGSALPHKKDKGEFDILKKKIPEVIVKLDDILAQNDEHLVFTEETFDNLKDRLDSLLSENHKLRRLLRNRKDEVKSLLYQVSDANEMRQKHSLAEADLLKQMGDLNLAMEESQMEAFLREEVYKCFLRHLSEESRNEIEELKLRFDVLNNNGSDVESPRKFEIEDSELECLVMQEFCGLIFGEGIKEVKDELRELYCEYLNEKEVRISTETKISQMENELKFQLEENDRLEQVVSNLEMSLEEKEMLAQDASAVRAKEREQFEQVLQELNAVKEFASQQQTLVSGSNKEVNNLKGQLAESLMQIEALKEEVAQLNRSLEEKVEEIKEANERRNAVLAISEERQSIMSSLEDKELELRKQVETLAGNINESSKMFTDFECRVTGSLRTNNKRFEHSSSQLHSLVKKANLLRRTMLMYQQRLDRKCSDLQLAEAEVDLLGDEVDTLLSLLEKIYIGLDHYSPVLKHYPGIMEILKLIRRELTGESTKPVKSSPT